MVKLSWLTCWLMVIREESFRAGFPVAEVHYGTRSYKRFVLTGTPDVNTPDFACYALLLCQPQKGVKACDQTIEQELPYNTQPQTSVRLAAAKVHPRGLCNSRLITNIHSEGDMT